MKERPVNRREFLKSGTLAAGVSIGAWLLGPNLLAPRPVCAGEKRFHQSSCRSAGVDPPKILVAYESHLGTTGEIAKTIGTVLCEHGATVDIRLVSNVDDLSPYHGAVIGSAVQRSQWMPDAIAFVEQNRRQLSRIPVAYFLACLAMAAAKTDDEKRAAGARRTAAAYMNPVLQSVPEVKPVDIGLFGGVLDYGKLSFIEKMVMKSKMEKKGIAEGDYRDWEAIRSWTAGLQPHFSRLGSEMN